MKLYVSGRLYFLQNKPDLRWAMQSYEDTALSKVTISLYTSLIDSSTFCDVCTIHDRTMIVLSQ